MSMFLTSLFIGLFIHYLFPYSLTLSISECLLCHNRRPRQVMQIDLTYLNVWNDKVVVGHAASQTSHLGLLCIPCTKCIK
jgi:hypothetical protein